MKHIFYAIGILPILWELMGVYSPRKVYQFVLNRKGCKTKKFDELTTNQKAFDIFGMGYIIWIFIGLFSGQWIVFLFMFVMGLIPKKYLWYRWIDSVVSVAILLFVILNQYHFHLSSLDIVNYIQSKF